MFKCIPKINIQICTTIVLNSIRIASALTTNYKGALP